MWPYEQETLQQGVSMSQIPCYDCGVLPFVYSEVVLAIFLIDLLFVWPRLTGRLDLALTGRKGLQYLPDCISPHVSVRVPWVGLAVIGKINSYHMLQSKIQ